VGGGAGGGVCVCVCACVCGVCVCVHVHEWPLCRMTRIVGSNDHYGVALASRIDIIIGLFCKRVL